MQPKHLVAGLTVAFLAATSALVYYSRQDVPDLAGTTTAVTGLGGTGAVGPAHSGTGGASSSSVTATPRQPDRPASNVPMTKLAPDETPPQFVLFSFDGAGSHERWQQFLAAADESDARFTAFLSGVYLLDDDHADAYTGPGHPAGSSSIGFGGSKSDILAEVADLTDAYLAGHEIGTHYNGHFCAGNNPSGDDWQRDDWAAELDQFSRFVDGWADINGYGDEAALPFSSGDIAGGRTPCLEGDLEQLLPAWKAHGMVYDTSKNLYTGIGWPEQHDGVWEFQVPYVYSPGFRTKVIAMDYNMWVTFNGAQQDPTATDRLRSQVRQTYDYMFQQAYQGNRAPVVIEDHFNGWGGGAFAEATLAFMRDTCGRDDVYCATFSDVVAWMEHQEPEVLADLQSRPVVAVGPDDAAG